MEKPRRRKRMMRMADDSARYHEPQEAWQQPDMSGRDSVLDVLGSRQRQRQGKMRNPLEGYSEKSAAKPAGARHGRRRRESESSDVSAASSFLYEEDLADLDQELEKESSSDEEWGKPKTKKKKMTFRAPRGRRGFGRTPFSYQPVSPYSQFGHPSPYPQQQAAAYYTYGSPGMPMGMPPQSGVYAGSLQTATSPYSQMGPPRGRFPGRPPAFGASAYDYNKPAAMYQTPTAVYQQQAPAFAYQQQMPYDPSMGAPFAGASPTEFNPMNAGEPLQSPYSDAIWDTMLQQPSPGIMLNQIHFFNLLQDCSSIPNTIAVFISYTCIFFRFSPT